MLGNLDFIISRTSKKHGIDKAILEEIYYTYWESVRQKLFYSEYPAIYLSKIGVISIPNKALRKEARECIRNLRHYKSQLKVTKEDDPKYEYYKGRYEFFEKRFKACWAQMEIYRKVFPVRGRRIEKWKKYHEQTK